MNNIEMLEYYIKALRKPMPFKFTNEQKAQAIENLIKENKELKEKAKNTMGLIGANYIHKDKIKEKIEEIKSKMNNDCIALHSFQREAQIDILQELLEEGGKQ